MGGSLEIQLIQASVHEVMLEGLVWEIGTDHHDAQRSTPLSLALTCCLACPSHSWAFKPGGGSREWAGK